MYICSCLNERMKKYGYFLKIQILLWVDKNTPTATRITQERKSGLEVLLVFYFQDHLADELPSVVK